MWTGGKGNSYLSGPEKQMGGKSAILPHEVVIKKHGRMERFGEVESEGKCLGKGHSMLE